MRVGDPLEWLAAVAFVVAVACATNAAWPTFLVAGACLAYFGQCFGKTPFPRQWKLTLWARLKAQLDRENGPA